MGYVGEKELSIEIEINSSGSPIVLAALNKVAAEKHVCPPGDT